MPDRSCATRRSTWDSGDGSEMRLCVARRARIPPGFRRGAVPWAPAALQRLARDGTERNHVVLKQPALDRAALTAHADRIVLVAGRESRGHPCYAVTVELGKTLGRDVIELPGGHIGFVTHPAEFALALNDALP